MDNPPNDREDPSATAPTLDALPRELTPGGVSGDSSSEQGQAAPVAVVEGAGPELTRETEILLRRRLRIAALLLFAGFVVFLVKFSVYSDPARPMPTGFLAFHVVVAAVLGLMSVFLCHRCSIPLRYLRPAEWIVFGLPAAYFLNVQYLVTLESCRTGRFEFIGGFWLVLMYTYALFIPNTLGRAAIVIGLLAATPLGLILYMRWTFPEVAEGVTWDAFSGITLLFIMSTVGSVFGVDTIGTLRREAFEARQVGQYRLKQRIGAGGMGEVYLAEHQLMKRPCVIKLIRPDRAGDPKTLARFQREVRATAKLSHWNTIEIFDYGSTDNGTFYYVMEYLPGMSLVELVNRYGPMPPERVVHLVRQVCDALSEAHAAGLIHRDIKPGNIFAALRGGVHDVAKLLDFGLVKPIIDEQAIHLTADGAITGSPLYMSPEQAVGDGDPDARSDIYSLGAVTYFLLAGRPPFTANKPLKILFAHAHDKVVPPSKYRQNIPADLERIVLQCLAKKPDDRFPDAATLAEALDACEAAGRWTRQDAARWWQEQDAETTV
jgi:serine/threonine-protein kinase